MTRPLQPKTVRRLLSAAAEEADRADAAQRYAIGRELGRGGMGIVYEAVDVELGRRVALKKLSPHATTPEARLRFAREAMIAARLAHPHVAAVYDATPELIAMQLVEGRPVDRLPRDDLPRIARVLRDAALAIDHAHRAGLVHRDIKPSNLLVDDSDHVFVVDFGLAKAGSAPGTCSVSGMVLGTPSFMAPEQAQGLVDAVDARSDVYGLGATLHACLSGRAPFDGDDVVDILRRVVEEEPAPSGADRELDLIARKCLRKEPAERYPSAAAFAGDLERWLDGRPIEARPPSAAYRVRKFVQRHRRLLRAAALAAAAGVVTAAIVLWPLALRERAGRDAAAAALRLSGRIAAALDDASSLRRVGQMAEANRILDEARDACDDFLGRSEVAAVWHLKGRLLRARGHTEPARRAFDRALQLEPALAAARFERGLLDPDQWPAASREDLSIGVSPEDGIRTADRLLGLAELARLQGELNAARAHLEKLRELDPFHPGAALALSRVAGAQGDGASALEFLLTAVNLQRGGHASTLTEQLAPADR